MGHTTRVNWVTGSLGTEEYSDLVQETHGLDTEECVAPTDDAQLRDSTPYCRIRHRSILSLMCVNFPI